MARVLCLPANLRFRYGYCLVERDAVLETQCPDGGVFLTEYDICLKLALSTARRVGRAYTTPLKLTPVRNTKTQRWDLKVRLGIGAGGRQYHTTYHRLVGLSFLETTDSLAGRRLDVPILVVPRQWSKYEVDHSNWNTLDCRLRNLCVRELHRHRGEGRDKWQTKTLSHSKKVQSLRRRPACAR